MQRRPRFNMNNGSYYPYMNQPINPYANNQGQGFMEEPKTTCKKEQAKEMTVPMGCNNTTYHECPPIYTCSKNIVDQYHITKQPYIHNYHTEVVHHYITENEYIPTYSKSEVHVNNNCCNR